MLRSLDPKFANLPYIVSRMKKHPIFAYFLFNDFFNFQAPLDQPDVFETSDLIESNETEFYLEEPENESIEKIKLNTRDSYNHFKGKYLVGNVDFSDNISKRKCIGYNAV